MAAAWLHRLAGGRAGARDHRAHPELHAQRVSREPLPYVLYERCGYQRIVCCQRQVQDSKTLHASRRRSTTMTNDEFGPSRHSSSSSS